MLEAFREVKREIPGARLAADSRFREVDLAIDWNEEASLPVEAADRIAVLMRERGFEATRSSVHVNVGPKGVDKLSACRAVVEHELGGDPRALGDYVYVGDALNDAPMFAGFPNAFGVANVRAVWSELAHHPRFVTDAAEGAGFEELARAILARLRAAHT
jgi:hydroxymethylpyrimidine pyrophosphatase-like HAD family hydrolase